MRAAQLAAVSDRLCYTEPAHDLIATEESQNGRKKSQRTMTACLAGTGEILLITPPPFLSQTVYQPALCSSRINYVLFLHTRAYWSWTPGYRLQLDAPNLGVARATASV